MFKDFPDITIGFCINIIDTNLSVCQIMLAVFGEVLTWPQMTSSQSQTPYKYL